MKVHKGPIHSHVAGRTLGTIDEHRLLVASVNLMHRTTLRDFARAKELLLLGDNIPATEEGVDIGPATVKAYSEILAGAKTILWNGPMGIFEDPRFAEGTFAVARAVAEATQKGAKSIIGGGDSVKAINKAKLGSQVTFMSTGGGASLEFLEGKALPGVAALQDKK